MIGRLAAVVACATLLCAGAVGAQEGQETAITAGPNGPTTDRTPTFSFSASEPDATFECAVNSETSALLEFEACTSPRTLALNEGAYTFHVRAIDAVGNADPTPATRAFAVDSGSLDTAIDAGPRRLTRDPSPSFTFFANVTGATFECRIESRAPSGPGADPALAGKTPASLRQAQQPARGGTDGPVSQAEPAVPGAETVGAAFAPCRSPFTVQPPLATGTYTFWARAVLRDRRDPTPAARAFMVDATPPQTTLVAPSPENGQVVGDRRPSFGYTASEPVLRFECRLDNTVKNGVDLAAWAPCPAAGFRAPELTGGQHRFEARAVDTAGNVDSSPAAVVFTVNACQTNVEFGLIQAEGECLKDVGTLDAPRYESVLPVKVNGIPFNPPGSSKVVLRPTPGGTGAGTLGLENIRIAIPRPGGGELKLWEGNLEVPIPAGGPNDKKLLLDVPLDDAADKLFGLELKGKFEIWLRHHATEFILRVELPGVFAASDGSSLSGEVAVQASNADGVRLNGAKIRVQEAKIGKVAVRDLCLSYVAAGATSIDSCAPPTSIGGQPAPFQAPSCPPEPDVERWDVSVVVTLPTTNPVTVGAWGGLADGKLSYAGGFVDGLNVPIFTNVNLKRIGFAICLGNDTRPFKLKGLIGISAGKEVTMNGQPTRPVELDAGFEFTSPWAQEPYWMLEVTADMRIIGRDVASAYFLYKSSGYLKFRVDVQWWFSDSPRAGFQGRVEAEITPEYFWAEVSADVCAPIIDCVGGKVRVSNKGAAVCATLWSTSVPWWQSGTHAHTHAIHPNAWRNHGDHNGASHDGIYYAPSTVQIAGGLGKRWDTPWYDFEAFTGCSWEDLRAIATTSHAGPESHEVDVKAGELARGFTILGDGDAPAVVLSGPRGERIETAADGSSIRTASWASGSNPARAETHVIVRQPSPGRWHVEPQLGSAPVVAVSEHRQVMPPVVLARVRGRGHRRVLEYGMKVTSDSQRVRLVERGPDTSRDLGATRPFRCRTAGPLWEELDRCGRIRFAPGEGRGGRRDVAALIEQDGMPLDDMNVASYVAPPPRAAGRPRKLRLRRTPRGGLKVSWQRSRNATAYEAVLRISDGRTIVRTLRAGTRHVVLIPRVARNETARVTVRGLRPSGSAGRRAFAKLPAVSRARRG